MVHWEVMLLLYLRDHLWYSRVGGFPPSFFSFIDLLMKITYIGWKNTNILVRKKMFVFNEKNNFTVDVVDYSYIYSMFQDKRYWKYLMFADDPKLNKTKLRIKKPFFGVLWGNVNSNPVVKVKTRTALWKSKTQTVEKLDTAIDDTIWDAVKDMDLDKIESDLHDTASKIKSKISKKTNETKKWK